MTNQMDSFFVYDKKPDDFTASVEISAVQVEYKGELLLLKRGPNQPEGNTWCVPAGKLEAKETPIEAAIRELFEETGIIVNGSSLQEFGKLYIRKPHVSYVCHLFRVPITMRPKILLSPEHTDFHWVTASETKRMPLIAGAKEMLLLYYQFLESKD